jgi:hypothetical protein
VTVAGKKQELQQAVYVKTADQRVLAAARATASPAADGGATPASARSEASLALKKTGVQPERIARTVAFVVDDLGLSFDSTVYVRKALHKYVDTQMQPGDLIAIVRTAGGIGALQQFTTDKRLLHKAADRVLWDFRSRRVGGFAAVEPTGPLRVRPGDDAEVFCGPGLSPVREGGTVVNRRPAGDEGINAGADGNAESRIENHCHRERGATIQTLPADNRAPAAEDERANERAVPHGIAPCLDPRDRLKGHVHTLTVDEQSQRFVAQVEQLSLQLRARTRRPDEDRLQVACARQILSVRRRDDAQREQQENAATHAYLQMTP